jgi:hypothetical protein
MLITDTKVIDDETHSSFMIGDHLSSIIITSLGAGFERRAAMSGRLSHRKKAPKRSSSHEAEIELTCTDSTFVEQRFMQHEFIAPDEMFDRESPKQPFASASARAVLIRKLLSDDYRKCMGELGELNPELLLALDHMTASSSDQRAARRVQASSSSSDSRSSHSHSSEQSSATATVTATSDDTQMHRRAMRLEFLIGLSMRMRNQTFPAFLCVCISLRCLQCGLPRSLWEILAGLRIIFSYQWTLDLAREIGRICSRYPSDDGVSRSVGMACADNCAYMVKLTFQHMEKTGEFLQTVNWYSMPLRVGCDGEVPEVKGESA